jgi:hypothetical protein
MTILVIASWLALQIPLGAVLGRLLQQPVQARVAVRARRARH